jgi:hypothetical protein
MKRIIGSQAIELLDSNPVYETLPSGQAEAYRLLMELGEGQHSEEAIVQQLGLKSRLPLWSRIEHLQERGMIRILKTVTA